MRKIPTLFARNHDGDKRVRDEVTPGCEWVLAGEGNATRKFDGTCCMVREGKLYRRHELRFRRGPQGTIDRVGGVPRDFEPACEIDAVTLKQQGWVPVGDRPEDRWHRDAWHQFCCEAGVTLPDGAVGPPADADGTYELCGPKVQGNPECFSSHTLVRHGSQELPTCPRDFAGVRAYLDGHPGLEGVVFHHPDGRMCKIKARDFGLA